MLSSRFSIITLCPFRRPYQGGPPVKSVNPDRTGCPIQSYRSGMPLRDPAAGGARNANRIVKTQFIELVAGKRVKITPQHAMHSQARETVSVGIRVDCAEGDRLDAAVPGVAKVRKPAPLACQRTVYLQARDVAFRSRKKTASRGRHAHVAQFKIRFWEPVSHEGAPGNTQTRVRRSGVRQTQAKFSRALTQVDDLRSGGNRKIQASGNPVSISQFNHLAGKRRPWLRRSAHAPTPRRSRTTSRDEVE